MTNREKAVEVITRWQKRYLAEMDNNPGGEEEDLAGDLDDAGLLVPDLPEPNDPGIFVPNGKGWLPCGPDGPSVWTAPHGQIMVQRIEPGELTPGEARGVAYALLAAADAAEEAAE